MPSSDTDQSDQVGGRFSAAITLRKREAGAALSGIDYCHR
jgi:hypothetical protein